MGTAPTHEIDVQRVCVVLVAVADCEVLTYCVNLDCMIKIR